MNTALVLSGKIDKEGLANLDNQKIDNIYDDVSKIWEILNEH
jgi:NagD protein